MKMMMTRILSHRDALTSLAAAAAMAALVACSSNSGTGATAGTGATGGTGAGGGASSTGGAGGAGPASTSSSTTSTGGSTTSTGGSTTTTTTTTTTSSSSSSGCLPANVVLSPAQTILTAVESSGLAVADVNKDGKADLLYNEEGTLVVSLSQGNSTFAAAKTYEGAGYDELRVGDLDGDGWPDVLSPGSDNGNVILAYALNNQDGTFGAFHNITELSDTGIRQALADFNGDGKLDIVNLGDQGVTILLNAGNASFPGTGTVYGESTSAAWAAAFGSDDVVDLAVGDVNGDGLPDLVVVVAGQSSSGPGGIYVSLNQNHGTSFSDPIHYATTANHDPLSIAIGDFNGDGLNDIATGGASGDLFNVYLNKGTTSPGMFKPAAAIAASGDTSATSMAAVDMNHDGKIDLVFFYGFGAGPWVALGNGDGTFSATLEAYSAGADQQGNEPMGIGDFNGNGLNGIAVLNTNMTTTAPNGAIQVLQATCAP